MTLTLIIKTYFIQKIFKLFVIWIAHKFAVIKLPLENEIANRHHEQYTPRIVREQWEELDKERKKDSLSDILRHMTVDVEHNVTSVALRSNVQVFFSQIKAFGIEKWWPGEAGGQCEQKYVFCCEGVPEYHQLYEEICDVGDDQHFGVIQASLESFVEDLFGASMHVALWTHFFAWCVHPIIFQSIFFFKVLLLLLFIRLREDKFWHYTGSIAFVRYLHFNLWMFNIKEENWREHSNLLKLLFNVY